MRRCTSAKPIWNVQAAVVTTGAGATGMAIGSGLGLVHAATDAAISGSARRRTAYLPPRIQAHPTDRAGGRNRARCQGGRRGLERRRWSIGIELNFEVVARMGIQ